MTVREFEGTGLHLLDSIAGLIRRAPADKLDWRPADSVMTLGQVLAHTASSFTPVVQIALGEHVHPPEGATMPSATPDEALAIVAEHKAKLQEALAGLSDEEWLGRHVTLPWGMAGSLGYCGGIAIDHAAGHRYQLFLYLKLLGQQLSTAELYGMQ